ncbi:O-antigen translocase [Sphingorhabdus sp.]|uniref:O-antigen translocase n=1 Tax=Sphingorhabdus sp. TaxID=1902408 RepID=UPI0035B0120C
MATALVLNKILAVYVGPMGYASIGQFQNAMAIAIAFASGAINSGVTKVTAENFDNEMRQRSLWRTAGTLTLCASAFLALFIMLFRESLAKFFLNNEALSGVFGWLAVSLVFISLNALLLSILNGKKDVGRYVISNIMGSFLGLAVVGLLTWQYEVYGALVALSVYQAVTFFATLGLCLKTNWFKIGDLFGKIDLKHGRTLAKFAFMALTTSIVAPLSQLFVRTHIGERFGWAHAGYWDAAWRISTIYLTFVTTTLSLYWLPRIAEIRSWAELRREILATYKIVLPFAVLAALIIYLMRDYIVLILFTPEFYPMRSLFSWQMAGDVMKLGSWVLAFIMVGKGMTIEFVLTETLAAVIFSLLTLLFTEYFGFRAVAMAHFYTYLVYWILVYTVTISTPDRRQRLFRSVS